MELIKRELPCSLEGAERPINKRRFGGFLSLFLVKLTKVGYPNQTVLRSLCLFTSVSFWPCFLSGWHGDRTQLRGSGVGDIFSLGSMGQIYVGLRNFCSQ